MRPNTGSMLGSARSYFWTCSASAATIVQSIMPVRHPSGLATHHRRNQAARGRNTSRAGTLDASFRSPASKSLPCTCRKNVSGLYNCILTRINPLQRGITLLGRGARFNPHPHRRRPQPCAEARAAHGPPAETDRRAEGRSTAATDGGRNTF
jgi:hypothetical protein